MPSYLSNSITVGQEFLKELNRMSNCNVVVQQLDRGGFSRSFRLYCEYCGDGYQFNDVTMLKMLPMVGDSGPKYRPVLKVEEFCLAHQHGAWTMRSEVTETDKPARKFRED